MLPKIKTVLFALAPLLHVTSLLFSAPAQAVNFGDSLGISPHLDWKVIQTEHFTVTFPKELEVIAQKASNYLEEANEVLTRKLEWQPHHRTAILVVDNADTANGLTTPIQRFGIVLQVTPPDNFFSIGFYDDWLRMLCYHEYTHLVNMDSTQGAFYNTVRDLIGDVILPNAFWPGWMLEGLAVYMETRLTHGGRGRSPFYEMISRAAVEEGGLDDPKFITLDKVNGRNPYYPGGETAYFFGYHLMNQTSKQKVVGEKTFDKEEPLKNGEEALGRMSLRSSRRIPYLINSNLKNIVGKDWYELWNEWITETRTRLSTDLERIRSQGVTPIKRLTENGYEALGCAASPDGKWLAYTQESLSRPSGLYLRNLENGHVKRLGDKILGVGMAFTPDSSKLLFSALERVEEYNLFSDLGYYDLVSGSRAWLSASLRARDPDISRDGKSVVFTLIENQTAVLASAPLLYQEGKLKLGPVRKLFTPGLYDRTANPKFSPDGKHIAFSLQRNGFPQEDLMSLELDSGQSRVLVKDGNWNRFPAYASNGDLYFVSNATHVDNIYRLVHPEGHSSKPELKTNVTTGLWLPTFGPSDHLYASVFSTRGWDIAEVAVSTSTYDSDLLTTSTPIPPRMDNQSEPFRKPEIFSVHTYSPWPSLIPRQWAPILFVDPTTTYAGAEILGFDAVDRHQYLLAAAYNSKVARLDWVAYYGNRTFGPTLELTSSSQNTIYTDGTSRDEFRMQAAASYPFLYTESSLTPSLSFDGRQNYYYLGSTTNHTRLRYHVDAALSYTDALSSRLAISPEEGRTVRIAGRTHFREGSDNSKGLITETEYIRVTDHSVIVPSIKASWVNQPSQITLDNDVVVTGRIQRVFDSFLTTNLDQLTIRGYSGSTFYVNQAAVGSLDYRFPIWQIYRGLGTNPVFFETLSGFVFGESAYIPDIDRSTRNFLTSAGGGVRFKANLFIQVPLDASIQYHQGFVKNLGGRGELFFTLGLGSIGF